MTAFCSEIHTTIKYFKSVFYNDNVSLTVDRNVPVDPDLDGVHSASATSLNSLQSFNTFTSMTTQVGSAIVPPTSTVASLGFSRTSTLRSSWANRYKKTNSDSTYSGINHNARIRKLYSFIFSTLSLLYNHKISLSLISN